MAVGACADRGAEHSEPSVRHVERPVTGPASRHPNSSPCPLGLSRAFPRTFHWNHNMSIATRIYRVVVNEGGDDESTHLVRANTPDNAVKHVLTKQVSANVATQDELVELASQGVAVETAIVHDRPGKPGRPKQKAA